MVETIAPVVYGNRRRYFIAVALHASTATLAAAALGALLGAIGGLFGAPWHGGGYAVVGGVGLLYALRELVGLPMPLFDRRKQVPQWWRTFYPRYVAASLYGTGLGVGYLTFLSYGTFVVVSVIAIVVGDPIVGAVVVAPFGLARGLSVLVSARTDDEEGPLQLVAKLVRNSWIRRVKIVNGIACLTLAAVAATQFL